MRIRDESTGYYYYGARYYDSAISIFLSVDPLAEKAPGWTPYRYGFNNPVNFTDPTGLFESKSEAKSWAKENNIRTGWFSGNKISKSGDGSWSVDNKRAGVSYSRVDSGMGLSTERADGVVESVFVGADKSYSQQMSDVWNSPLVRSMVADSYSVGLSSNVSVFLGVGTTPINFTLLTRGQELGLYFTPTINAALGDGLEANAGISFGRGIYTGNPRDINSGMLQGHTYGVSGGLGAVLDASAGVFYAPAGNGNGFINVSGQIGVGIEGSPASVINLQGNYQYTPVVKPIVKF